MLDLVIRSKGIEPIVERLQAMRDRLLDLEWMANEIAAILEEETRSALLFGIDKDGDTVAELSPETVKRRARAGRGTGPARAPDERSRFLTNIRTEVIQLGVDHWRVRLWWEDMPHLRYFIEGTEHMPPRDPVGVTPSARTRIGELIRSSLPRIVGA